MRIRSKYFLDAEKCKMISNINLRYSVDKTNKHKETKKKKESWWYANITLKNKYLPLVKQKYVNDKKKKAIQKPFRVNTY